MTLFEIIGQIGSIIGGAAAIVAMHRCLQSYIMRRNSMRMGIREGLAVIIIAAPCILIGITITYPVQVSNEESFIIGFMMGYLMCMVGFVMDFYLRQR